MAAKRIALDVDDLRLDVKAGLRRAAEMGVREVELGATAGDIAAWNLSASGRRHLARFVDGLGLGLAALTADLPGLRFNQPQSVDERVERTIQVLEMARQMDIPSVSADAHRLADSQSGEPLPGVAEALARVADAADALGVHYALRPSHDAGPELAALLRKLDCRAVKIGMDPAALVMHGVNPIASFEELADHIDLVYARDGTAGSDERSGHETSLGQGEVDLIAVLACLSAADYRGPYILRRSASTAPESDLMAARDELTRLLPP